jgi:hypothetical protein
MITAHRVCFPTEHRTMRQDDSHTGDGDSQRACIAISIALLCWSPSCVVSIHAVRACCFRCCAIIFFGSLCCSIPIVPVLFRVSFCSVCLSHSAIFCGVSFTAAVLSECLCCSVLWVSGCSVAWVSVLMCSLSVCVVLFREFLSCPVVWVSVLLCCLSVCVLFRVPVLFHSVSF